MYQRSPAIVRRTLCRFALLAAPLLACGDDASSAPPLATDKLLSELTFQETLQLCGRFDELTIGDPVYVRGTCAQVGLLTAAMTPGKSCEQVRDDCAVELKTNRVCWIRPDMPAQEDPDCATATAGDLTSCFEAVTASAKQRYAEVTCSDPSSSVPLQDVSGAWHDLKENPIPGCEALAESCPTFFEPADDSEP